MAKVDTSTKKHKPKDHCKMRTGGQSKEVERAIKATKKPLEVNMQRDSAAALDHAREQNATAEQPKFWESATEK